MGWFKSGLRDDEIDVDTLGELIAAGTAPFIVDVREPYEVSENAFPGALNIPLGDLDARLAEVPRDKPVAILCRSGARSARAVTFLKQSGLGQVKNILGGIMAWDQRKK